MPNSIAFTGRRNSEIHGKIISKRSSAAVKAREVGSPMVRRPLSPVSLAISSKANIANFLEDQKRTQNGTSKKVLPSNKTQAVTPSKSILAGNDENKTPKTTPISVPTTPSQVSVSMLMATTPATPCVSLGAKAVERMAEQNEYSFEEVRYYLC